MLVRSSRFFCFSYRDRACDSIAACRIVTERPGPVALGPVLGRPASPPPIARKGDTRRPDRGARPSSPRGKDGPAPRPGQNAEAKGRSRPIVQGKSKRDATRKACVIRSVVSSPDRHVRRPCESGPGHRITDASTTEARNEYRLRHCCGGSAWGDGAGGRTGPTAWPPRVRGRCGSSSVRSGRGPYCTSEADIHP